MPSAMFLHSFERTDAAAYAAYRRIKFQVFVTEQGWASLRDDASDTFSKEDPYDAASSFMLAKTLDGTEPGVLRCTMLKHAFPHEKLFADAFSQGAMRGMRPYMCTVNGLAVLPGFRRIKFRVPGTDWEGTMAQLLTLRMISLMEEAGNRAVILTASTLPATRLFASLGFFVIDPPLDLEADGRRRVYINMGLLCGSEEHIKAQKACRMTPRVIQHGSEEAAFAGFLSARQKTALGHRTIDSFFA